MKRAAPSHRRAKTKQASSRENNEFSVLLDRSDIALEIAIVVVALGTAGMGVSGFVPGLLFGSIVLATIIGVYAWKHWPRKQKR